MNVSNIQDLPIEMLERIFLFCPIEEQLQYERVSTCCAAALRSAVHFPELRLFKDSIVVLNKQRQRLREISLLSTRSVIWLNTVKDVAAQHKYIALISGIVGVPLNSMLSQIPVVNYLYYPYELLGVGGLWYSPLMIPAYAAISYVSLTAEVASTHLLATNEENEKEKNTLSKAVSAQQQFLANYWAHLKRR